MSTSTLPLAELITGTIRQLASDASTQTTYRQPLVDFAAASNPRFQTLKDVVDPSHMLPAELLPGARAVVSFFLPFAPGVVEANASHKEMVADQWVVAYVETSALIGRITDRLIGLLAQQGIQAAAEPATYNFDEDTLVSRWAHKSVAVIAGLGSYGLHQMVITDAGCAGRFGSLVLDTELPVGEIEPVGRCLYYHDAGCLECVMRCPVGALDSSDGLYKQACWSHLQEMAQTFSVADRADVCGKCAIGPCSLGSAIQ